MHTQHVSQLQYDVNRFSTSEIARAAGVKPVTLRSYFRRQQWRQIGQAAKGKGLPTLFSLRDALTYAVAARLVDMGVDPASAFDSAVMDFAHTGDERRNPAELFNPNEDGLTLLVYWPRLKKGRVVPADVIGSIEELVSPPFSSGTQEGTLVLVLNFIEASVMRALAPVAQ